MKHTTIFAATGLVLAIVWPASATTTLNARSFVSPTGNDANACTLNFPCRNFQPAYAKTNPGGEIAVLGTAGYGTLVIDHAISIVNAGGFEAGIFVASGGTGITINAGATDAIVLRGLTINGGGVGYNGIVFNSGKSLTVDNCVVQNFSYGGNFSTGNGIFIAPTSGTMTFTITNATASNNGHIGIYYVPLSGAPNANGTIDHVVATGNGTYGIAFTTTLTLGGTTTAAVSNSVVSDNSSGLFVGGTLSVSIDNVALNGNANAAIDAWPGTTLLLGHSTIVGNGLGISHGNSKIYTYQDNQIYLNGNNNAVDGDALVPVSFQ